MAYRRPPDKELLQLLDHASLNWQKPIPWGFLANDPCVYCGWPADSWEHLVPRSKGGNQYFNNLARACGSCNQRKGGLDLLTFLVVKDRRLLPQRRSQLTSFAWLLTKMYRGKLASLNPPGDHESARPANSRERADQ